MQYQFYLHFLVHAFVFLLLFSFLKKRFSNKKFLLYKIPPIFGGNMEARIDAKGRIVIPQSVREKLQIKEGMLISIEEKAM